MTSSYIVLGNYEGFSDPLLPYCFIWSARDGSDLAMSSFKPRNFPLCGEPNFLLSPLKVNPCSAYVHRAAVTHSSTWLQYSHSSRHDSKVEPHVLTNGYAKLFYDPLYSHDFKLQWCFTSRKSLQTKQQTQSGAGKYGSHFWFYFSPLANPVF